MELHWLSQVAQARNREEGISDLIIIKTNVFTIGCKARATASPAPWESIRNDPRQTDLIILEQREVATRFFTGWSMKIAASESAAAPFQDDVIEVPMSLMRNLNDNPEFVPSIMMKMSPHQGAR